MYEFSYRLSFFFHGQRNLGKFNFFPTGPVCEICGKVFANNQNLNRHVRSMHEKSSTSFSCTDCDYCTSRKHDLKRHTKIHSNTAPVCDIPPKIACREPYPNIVQPTENDQFLSDIEQQELTDMFSSQFGYGVTQTTPADENIPQELRDFFRDE